MSDFHTDEDGFTDLTDEENDMAGNVPDGDLSNDSLELLLEQQLASHDSLMTETTGNYQGANSIVRYSAARKFNQEDPIEAASAEMILQRNQ